MVPEACCWTEGPGTVKQLFRQRTRWARGLFEIVSNHRKLFFNPHYGPIGALTMPYIFIFEFLAPILEMMGFLFMLWLTPTGGVNWRSAIVVFGMIYLFCLFISSAVIYNDYRIKAVNWKSKRMNYFKLMVASVLEPFIYHPFQTFCSNIGYLRFIRNTRAVWTPIKRQGFKKKDQ
jgi:cellulose synthase/poly-beta-1,6-N-acetylglucosamine synthase-like glycosyltransferase